MKEGDIVTWNIKKGINPIGKIIKVEKYPASGGYPAFRRYRVKATKTISYKSQYGGISEIIAGEWEGYPHQIKKVR